MGSSGVNWQASIERNFSLDPSVGSSAARHIDEPNAIEVEFIERRGPAFNVVDYFWHHGEDEKLSLIHI